MNNKLKQYMFLLGFGFLVFLFLSKSTFITIKPGEAGVLFKKFSGGLNKEMVYGQGFHVVAPWNEMHIYNVQEQTAEESAMPIKDKNGLNITADITVRFKPYANKIGFLHERFGVTYVENLIIPEIRSAVRRVMGKYSAEEIYSTKKEEVESAILEESMNILSTDANNIEVNALLIRAVELPDNIKRAIELKLQQEQEALAYQFRLDKEKSEAERKRIAAEGEAAANKIVNSSLTPELLRMRGIEATIELSKSPNSKVVVIGSGDDGLPLILGNN